MMNWLQTLALHSYAVDFQELDKKPSTTKQTEETTQQVGTNPATQLQACSELSCDNATTESQNSQGSQNAGNSSINHDIR